MRHWFWARKVVAIFAVLALLAPQAGDALARQTPIPETGVVTVQLHACPAGMRPLEIERAACAPDPDVADLQIFILGSGENRRDLSVATRDGNSFTWSGLPFAEYLLKADGFAAGYDRYLIPALPEGLNIAPDMGYTAGPNEGYIVPLDAEHPARRLDVYVFRAFEGTGSARVDVRLWQCAPGVAAAPDMRDFGCSSLTAPPAGFVLEIAGAAVERPLQLDEATPNAAGVVGWDDVPSGEYRVTARLPEGTPGYAVRSYDPALRVRLLSDQSGYALVLDPGRALPEPEEGIALDVYLLQ